jgi:hypothetical protein
MREAWMRLFTDAQKSLAWLAKPFSWTCAKLGVGQHGQAKEAKNIRFHRYRYFSS